MVVHRPYGMEGGFAVELDGALLARLMPDVPLAGLAPVLVVGTGDHARVVEILHAAAGYPPSAPPLFVSDGLSDASDLVASRRGVAIEDAMKTIMVRAAQDLSAEMVATCRKLPLREEPTANGKGFYRRFEKRRPDGGFIRRRQGRKGR